jgi:acetoacetyl-CoA synthetase
VDSPIYALQAQGLDGCSPVLTSVEAMARHYRAELDEDGVHGPCVVAGLSFGGLVAYEMAQQMTRAGRSVPLLVLLDTHRPTAWRFLVRHAAASRALGLRAGFAYLVERARGRFRKSVATRRRDATARSGHPVLLAGRANEMQEIADEAARRYRPRPYAGRVMIVEGERGCASLWRRLVTQPPEVHRLPCDHASLLREPHVRDVAALLRTAILRVSPPRASRETAS